MRNIYSSGADVLFWIIELLLKTVQFVKGYNRYVRAHARQME